MDSLLARGGLSENPDDLAAAADDFGHIVHRVPTTVARPRSAAEVAELVRHAASAGLRLVPRGAGHSVYGQAQADEGIVCDLSDLNQVHRLTPDSIVVDAGTRWGLVVTTTHGLRATPPVLTDYMELTVGGTLSAGGIGGASHQRGAQVDNVISLDLVTCDGDLVSCSPTRNPDVFYSALGTFGEGGVIVRAEIPLMTAPAHVRRWKLRYRDLGSMIADQLLIASEQRFGYIEGQILPVQTSGWEYILEAAAFTDAIEVAGDDLLDVLQDERGLMESEDLGWLDFCHRMVPGVKLLAASGDWYRPHPWFSVFLPASKTERYVASFLDTLSPEMVGPIPMLLYPLRRGQAPAPGLRTPAGDDMFFSLSLLRTVDSGMVPAAIEHNGTLHRAGLACGGITYPVSALP